MTESKGTLRRNIRQSREQKIREQMAKVRPIYGDLAWLESRIDSDRDPWVQKEIARLNQILATLPHNQD